MTYVSRQLISQQHHHSLCHLHHAYYLPFNIKIPYHFVGDGEGKVGYGRGKAREVPLAIQKATENARRSMVQVQLKNNTLQHQIVSRHGASKVLMIPASEGTGVIAGDQMQRV